MLGVAALVLVAPFARGGARAVRALGISLAASLLAVILLLPWPLAYLRSGTDAASVGLTFRPRLDLADVLRFHSGPVHAEQDSLVKTDASLQPRCIEPAPATAFGSNTVCPDRAYVLTGRSLAGLHLK